jgi:predicted transcriptional regulator
MTSDAIDPELRRWHIGGWLSHPSKLSLQRSISLVSWIKEKQSYSMQLLFILIVMLILGTNCYASDATDSANSSQLALDIYIGDTGNALVTGYAEDISGLSFLETSQYQYDNNTSQLYAITNSLTWKYEDDWEVRFATDSFYDELHINIYFPIEIKLSRINSSEELDYYVTASSDSFIVEFHGYDVQSPTISIVYMQPLQSEGVADEQPSHLQISITAIILLLFSIIVSFAIRKRSNGAATEEVNDDLVAGQSARDEVDMVTAKEVSAVMETLTEREQSVLRALVEHGGKMTQAEIRYETGIPKSSLTGIILSLERRRIVTKKEWGRTNVIELSDRLKSEKSEE